jgi:predicted esterase
MDHSFLSSKTYRYFTSGELNKSDKLLIVLHGYGQLAKFFISKFKNCPEKYFVIAPEGPHRFYKQGYSGRVGASWMTKEAREDDIKDNLTWLNALMEDFTKEKSFKEVIVLGFSQGGATAARWYYNDIVRFNRLILWSSVFPPDIDKSKITEGHKNHYVVGDKDEFINESLRKEEVLFYKKLGFSITEFEGNHDINAQVLNDILA